MSRVDVQAFVVESWSALFRTLRVNPVTNLNPNCILASNDNIYHDLVSICVDSGSDIEISTFLEILKGVSQAENLKNFVLARITKESPNGTPLSRLLNQLPIIWDDCSKQALSSGRKNNQDEVINPVVIKIKLFICYLIQLGVRKGKVEQEILDTIEKRFSEKRKIITKNQMVIKILILQLKYLLLNANDKMDRKQQNIFEERNVVKISSARFSPTIAAQMCYYSKLAHHANQLDKDYRVSDIYEVSHSKYYCKFSFTPFPNAENLIFYSILKNLGWCKVTVAQSGGVDAKRNEEISCIFSERTAAKKLYCLYSFGACDTKFNNILTGEKYNLFFNQLVSMLPPKSKRHSYYIVLTGWRYGAVIANLFAEYLVNLQQIPTRNIVKYLFSPPSLSTNLLVNIQKSFTFFLKDEAAFQPEPKVFSLVPVENKICVAGDYRMLLKESPKKAQLKTSAESLIKAEALLTPSMITSYQFGWAEFKQQSGKMSSRKEHSKYSVEDYENILNQLTDPAKRQSDKVYPYDPVQIKLEGLNNFLEGYYCRITLIDTISSDTLLHYYGGLVEFHNTLEDIRAKVENELQIMSNAAMRVALRKLAALTTLVVNEQYGVLQYDFVLSTKLPPGSLLTLLSILVPLLFSPRQSTEIDDHLDNLKKAIEKLTFKLKVIKSKTGKVQDDQGNDIDARSTLCSIRKGSFSGNFIIQEIVKLAMQCLFYAKKFPEATEATYKQIVQLRTNLWNETKINHFARAADRVSPSKKQLKSLITEEKFNTIEFIMQDDNNGHIMRFDNITESDGSSYNEMLRSEDDGQEDNPLATSQDGSNLLQSAAYKQHSDSRRLLTAPPTSTQMGKISKVQLYYPTKLCLKSKGLLERFIENFKHNGMVENLVRFPGTANNSTKHFLLYFDVDTLVEKSVHNFASIFFRKPRDFLQEKIFGFSVTEFNQSCSFSFMELNDFNNSFTKKDFTSNKFKQVVGDLPKIKIDRHQYASLFLLNFLLDLRGDWSDFYPIQMDKKWHLVNCKNTFHQKKIEPRKINALFCLKQVKNHFSRTFIRGFILNLLTKSGSGGEGNFIYEPTQLTTAIDEKIAEWVESISDFELIRDYYLPEIKTRYRLDTRWRKQLKKRLQFVANKFTESISSKTRISPLDLLISNSKGESCYSHWDGTPTDLQNRKLEESSSRIVSLSRPTRYLSAAIDDTYFIRKCFGDIDLVESQLNQEQQYSETESLVTSSHTMASAADIEKFRKEIKRFMDLVEMPPILSKILSSMLDKVLECDQTQLGVFYLELENKLIRPAFECLNPEQCKEIYNAFKDLSQPLRKSDLQRTFQDDTKPDILPDNLLAIYKQLFRSDSRLCFNDTISKLMVNDDTLRHIRDFFHNRFSSFTYSKKQKFLASLFDPHMLKLASVSDSDKHLIDSVTDSCSRLIQILVNYKIIMEDFPKLGKNKKQELLRDLDSKNHGQIAKILLSKMNET